MLKNKRSLLNNFEFLVPILLTVSLSASCIIISGKKPFWFDELFSYYFLSDSSFLNMLHAFHDKINNTPIVYFFIGWFWDKLFGSSELSLRLFSTIGMCIAFFITWVTLRRTYGFWPTTIGSLSVFCTSQVILQQNAEARMYGLFLAVCSIAFLYYDRFFSGKNLSFKTLIYNGVVHAAIIHTHLFGPFYSAAILFSTFFTDKYFGRFRPKVYLSVILSWFTFLFYIPSFLNQADAGKPRTWLPMPTLQDLITYYDLSSFIRIDIICPLLIISVLNYLLEKKNTSLTEGDYEDNALSKNKVPLLIFACSFFVLPAFVWLFSRTIKPIFWERYMIPSALGVVVLITFLTSRLYSFNYEKLVERGSRNIKFNQLIIFIVPCCLAIFSAYLLLQPVWYAKRFSSQSTPGSYDEDYGYSDLPIVVLNSNFYLQRQFYSVRKDKYYFILDWKAANSPRSGVWATQEYKHLTALKKIYPKLFDSTILHTNDFLKKYDRFLVMSYYTDTATCPLLPVGLEMARSWVGMHCPQWMQLRLENNNEYQVKTLGANYGISLLLVDKVKKVQ
jgi:hypothetical protein